MPVRVVDDFTVPDELQWRILVRCPGCDGPAELRRTERRWYRSTCVGCGRIRQLEWPGFSRHHLADRDGHLLDADLVLWLRTPCRGRTLWAYGPEHLELLARLVGAELRERRRHPEHGWSNQSVLSRLPTWMKAGGARADVLAGLARLRALLPDHPQAGSRDPHRGP